MRQNLRASFTLLMLFVLITGLGYPFVVKGIGDIFFPHQASGSLVAYEGKIIGSSLIGQAFLDDKYFHPRPSAAGNGYDASNSMGSNLAPTSSDLIETVVERTAELRNPDDVRSIPVDLVTSSGSGLDPHISVASAFFQAPRVAEARKMTVPQVEALISKNTEKRTFGVLGEKRVNVLAINMDLDLQATETASAPAPVVR